MTSDFLLDKTCLIPNTKPIAFEWDRELPPWRNIHNMHTIQEWQDTIAEKVCACLMANAYAANLKNPYGIHIPALTAAAEDMGMLPRDIKAARFDGATKAKSAPALAWKEAAYHGNDVLEARVYDLIRTVQKAQAELGDSTAWAAVLEYAQAAWDTVNEDYEDLENMEGKIK